MRTLAATVILALMVPIADSAQIAAGAAQPQTSDALAPTGAAAVRADCEKVRALTPAPAAQQFLDAAALLEPREARTVYVNREKREYLSRAQFEALAEDQRAGFEPRELDEQFYYHTRYGTPAAYARPLQVLGEHVPGFDTFQSKRVLDFGCGGIAPVQLFAGAGAHAVGVDVDPLLPLLYDQPGDQGERPTVHENVRASATLVTGRWPGDAATATAAGGNFDLILSKNTLKRGYIHPEREADARMLIDLGVPDEDFVRALADALNPGGVLLIYNFCPAQAPADKPYIPWADGRCPFPREMLEAAGFEVLAFDRNDDEAARALFQALGYPTVNQAGEPDLFAWYTVARKRAEQPAR